MKISGVLCLLYLSVFSPKVVAEKVWILGSFSKLENAIPEQVRLKNLLGVPVTLRPFRVDGQQYHRLIIADNKFSAEVQAQLSLTQLSLWALELETKHSPLNKQPDTQKTTAATTTLAITPITVTAPQLGFYLVAGSYSDVGEALELENRLSQYFNRVSNQTTILKGQVYHRVLVGPISSDLVDSTRLSLSEQGYSGAWLINASTESVMNEGLIVRAKKLQDTVRGSDQKRIDENDQEIETLLKIPARPLASQKQASQKDSNSDANKRSKGFNLARLPEKNPVFSMPGKRVANGRWYFESAFEHRQFSKGGLFQLNKAHSSFRLESEYTASSSDERNLFTFLPFYRWDSEDADRTHFDIRELSWVHVFDNWELRTGLRKVFWGVTEAQHLVDIINQTDNLENVNGEDKLGQGMINLSWISEWGIFDVYWLLGFRERQYAGRNGRPRLPFLVDEDLAVFESSAGNMRSDFALRWTQTIGELELGLSHFSGTSREPRMEAGVIFDINGVPVDALLIPRYDVIDQTGMDAQFFMGDWAWKLEFISRSGQGTRFNAFAFGFEKTIVGLFGSRADLGIVAEYLYDNRQQLAPVIGEDDLAIGFRLTLNDAADSTALLVFLMDRDSDEILTSLEASMRIGSNWRVIVDATFFSGSSEITPGFSGILSSLNNTEEEISLFQDEDFIRIELTRYF